MLGVSLGEKAPRHCLNHHPVNVFTKTNSDKSVCGTRTHLQCTVEAGNPTETNQQLQLIILQLPNISSTS